MNITDPIRIHARERPDAIAGIRQRRATVTYAAVDRAIDNVAKRIRALGVGPGAIAIVASPVPHRDLMLRLALARLGAAGATDEFPTSRANFCFVERAFDVAGIPNKVVIDRTWFDDAPTDGDAVPSHQDGSAVLAVFAATSPTERARFVAVTHDMMAKRIEAADRAVPMPDSVRQMCIPMTMCAHGYLSLMRVLWAGGTNVMAPGKIDDIVVNARECGVNRLVLLPAAVPPLLAALPKEGRPLPLLAQVELSGAALPEPLYQLARERLCDAIHSVYRMTEGGFVATAPMATLDRGVGEVGRALPGVEAVAIDGHGAELPPGTEGLLRLRGEGFVGNYLYPVDTTPSPFRDGGFVPGDVGSVAPDGTIRLAVRESAIINAGGVRVLPRAVELAMAAYPWIRDVAVFPLVDKHGLAQVAAAIVPKDRIDPREVATLRARLDVQAPSVLMQVKDIPRDARGQVQRDVLVAMARAGRGTATSH